MLSAEQVDVSLGPSRLYLLAMTVVGAGALGGLIFADLTGLMTLALALAVCVSAVDATCQHGFRTGERAVTRIVYSESGWRLWLTRGEPLQARCHGDIVVLRWLVVLNFVDEAGVRRAVVVLPDTMNAEAFRRLKVFLRLFNRSAEEQAACPAPPQTSRDSRG